MKAQQVWTPFEIETFRSRFPSELQHDNNVSKSLFSGSLQTSWSLPPDELTACMSDAFKFDDEKTRATASLEDAPSVPPLVNIAQPIEISDHDWFVDVDSTKALETQYHTWEEFAVQRPAPPPNTSYLSEAPLSVVNGLICNAGYGSEKVIANEPVFRAACSLLLGQTSSLFEWDHSVQSFSPRLQDYAVSGASKTLSNHVLSAIAKQGSLLRRLREISDRPRLVTLAAYKAAVVRIINLIDARSLSTVSALRSLLQVQHASSQINGILEVLWEIYVNIKDVSTDEQVVTTLQRMQVSLTECMSLCTPILAAVTDVVYQPWLDQLVQSIQDPHRLDDDEDTRTSIMKQTDRELIHRATSNVQFIRRHLPSHMVPRLILSDRGENKGSVDHLNVPHDQSAWSAFTFESDVFRSALESKQDEIGDIETALDNHFDQKVQDLSVRSISDVMHDPLATVRPLLQRHAQMSSNAVLQHLFATFDLDAYFNLRSRYFLFRDVDFVDRLRRAIFGSGLQLNDLTQVSWPPTTSKLSLSLMGISSDQSSVSFTVGQLSETEMEKACDAMSIHALQFLKLQIDTPAPLRELFGKDSAEEYDRIFTALLLDTRMLHLVTMLRRQVIARHKRSNDHAGVIHHMYHVVSTLASHSIQLAISKPWSRFMKVLDAAKKQQAGLDALQEAHKKCLLSIRSGLFLRHSQAKVRAAVEAVYAHVLSSGKKVLLGSILSADNGQLNTLTLQLSTCVEDYIRQLQKSATSDDEEIQMVNLLFTRLTSGC